jgi:hypothetical protein
MQEGCSFNDVFIWSLGAADVLVLPLSNLGSLSARLGEVDLDHSNEPGSRGTLHKRPGITLEGTPDSGTLMRRKVFDVAIGLLPR